MGTLRWSRFIMIFKTHVPTYVLPITFVELKKKIISEAYFIPLSVVIVKNEVTTQIL